ncbi:MAG: flagellar basal body rod protein FlgC [Clostridiales bacterium]|nr:flagellar basal body rod protein FlgC [Clostridiales bacterium]
MFKAFDISASALTMQKLRMDVIAQNIANAQTTRTDTDQPYRRKIVVVEENRFNKSFSQYLAESGVEFSGSGVKASRIAEDPSPFKMVYDPGHPDANEEGYVLMPNVDTVREMVDMISATRSYEANVTAFNASKNMAMKALEIGR